MEASHQHKISSVAKEYEEKISFLLRQLRGVAVEGVEQDFQERCAIQQEALEQAEQELEDIIAHTQKTEEQLKEENRELRRRLDEIKFEQSSEAKTPEPIPEKSNVKKKMRKSLDNALTTFNECDSYAVETSFKDDPNTDPDWRKTPLARRIQKMRNSSMIQGDRWSVKRSSDGSCACRGNCSKRSLKNT